MFLKEVEDASKWFGFWYSGYKFRGNSFYVDRVGLGFGGVEDFLLEKISRADKEACIGLVNDYDLSLTRKLWDLGFHNLVLISTDREVDDMYRNHLYNLPTIQKAVSKSDVSAFWQKIVYIEEKELPTGKVDKKTGEIKMKKQWVVEGADNMKFDYVISNPPYAIGNKITKAIVENVNFDTMVNLMPASKYKGGNLYEHVSELSSAEDTFEDAMVGDSLTVAVLKKENANVYHSYEEFENEKRDPRFREFYKLNACNISHKLDYAWNFIFRKTEEALKEALRELDIDKDFMITMRTVLDGTHHVDGKGAHDICWNIEKSYTADDIHIVYDKSMKNWHTSVTFIHFQSSIEKNNLCRFWYYNPLLNSLIKGLGKSSGSPEAAIPRIDWSVERDYEHLTLEDIMNILREEV